MKNIFTLFFFITLTISSFAQTGKVFYFGETQCAYVIENNMIYESGSTNCTARVPLYDIKEDRIYYHNSPKECAIVVKDDKIYFSSRNSDEIDRVMWVIKGDELVYPDRQSDAAFIIEDTKVFFGSNNKVNRKDRQILTLEGDIPKVALYMILYQISQ